MVSRSRAPKLAVCYVILGATSLAISRHFNMQPQDDETLKGCPPQHELEAVAAKGLPRQIAAHANAADITEL
jgi:hypothetical protein